MSGGWWVVGGGQAGAGWWDVGREMGGRSTVVCGQAGGGQASESLHGVPLLVRRVHLAGQVVIQVAAAVALRDEDVGSPHPLDGRRSRCAPDGKAHEMRGRTQPSSRLRTVSHPVQVLFTSQDPHVTTGSGAPSAPSAHRSMSQDARRSTSLDTAEEGTPAEEGLSRELIAPAGQPFVRSGCAAAPGRAEWSRRGSRPVRVLPISTLQRVARADQGIGSR